MGLSYFGMTTKKEKWWYHKLSYHGTYGDFAQNSRNEGGVAAANTFSPHTPPARFLPRPPADGRLRRRHGAPARSLLREDLLLTAAPGARRQAEKRFVPTPGDPENLSLRLRSSDTI